jgi:hypothetical protein
MTHLTHKEFASHMNTPRSTVSGWGRRGWLVIENGLINVEATKDMLLRMRGTLGKMDQRERSMRSAWRWNPACETRRAFATFKGGAK